MKEFDSVKSRSKFGYPEGMFYTVQDNAWMDKARMHNWIDTLWSPYTKDTHRGGRDTYLLMDELSVHLMGEINDKLISLALILNSFLAAILDVFKCSTKT
jgi:hypothetical protein